MAEFNFYADPEAAHVVLKKLEGNQPLKITIVTWELCHSYFNISWVRSLQFRTIQWGSEYWTFNYSTHNDGKIKKEKGRKMETSE